MTMPFNPSRFTDMLDESFYASGQNGEQLKQERENLVACPSALARRAASAEPSASRSQRRSCRRLDIVRLNRGRSHMLACMAMVAAVSMPVMRAVGWVLRLKQTVS